jgi:hypothetical protein
MRAYFKFLYRHLPEETEETQKTSVRVVGVPAEIRNGHLRNASQKRYLLSQLT